METIFDKQTIERFKNRIEKITENSTRQWGKFTVYQMLKHATENDRMLLRDQPYKRLFIGRLFGKMALRKATKNDAPNDKNSPTHPYLVIKGIGNVEEQKKIWLNVLDKYPQLTKAHYLGFVHPFYGSMTADQVSIVAYKHIDHHLRQFGV
jgi:hypothetical protein